MKNDSIQLIFNESGIADVYDDTYDITIHCESKQERDEAIRRMKGSYWIPIEEMLPDPDKLIILSFTNFTIPMLGRYTVDDEDSGTFRIGYEDASFAESNLFVNAWMKLPEPFGCD